MDSQKVDLFLAANQKFFSPTQILTIKDRLLALDDDKFTLINALDYKDPTMMIIVSVFAGSLGIDRFMLGDTGYGVLKLLTCGGCGILTIIDWFNIQDLTRNQNYTKAPADHQLSPPSGSRPFSRGLNHTRPSPLHSPIAPPSSSADIYSSDSCSSG